MRADITRDEGRTGEPQEYVEFRCPDGVAFVAQRNIGGVWYVYEVHPGKKGKIATLLQFDADEKMAAIAYAELAADKWLDGVKIQSRV